MKRNFKRLLPCFVVVMLLLGGGFFLQSMKISFAIKTGSYQPSLPSSTFSSIYGSDTINYVGDALGSNNQYSHNFVVPSISDSATPHYLLMKNLETPKKNSETFELVNGNPTTINDKGIQFILNHGYNKFNTVNTVFGSENLTVKQKFYVTQVALWLYIYETKNNQTTYCANGGCTFTDSSSNAIDASAVRSTINQASEKSNFKYLKHILTLVDDAKNYTGATTTPNFTISNEKVTYVIDAEFKELTTDIITPVYEANNFMYYTLEITDPNHYGAYITDTNGNKITDTSKMSGSFRIVVPLNEDLSKMDLTSVKITVFGYFFKDGAYSYRVTNSTTGSLINKNKTQKYSDILFGDIPYMIDGVSFQLNNFEKISKIDSSTKKELPGATLEITNIDNPEIKDTWVTSAVPHYTHLEDGNYKLCELNAPSGYALNKDCIEFTVDGRKILSITMGNDPLYPSQDTSFFGNHKSILIGIIFILLGSIGVYMGTRMKKASN